jgi:hypothetical protein
MAAVKDKDNESAGVVLGENVTPTTSWILGAALAVVQHS